MWHDAKKENPGIELDGTSRFVLCETVKLGDKINYPLSLWHEVLWWNGKTWENINNRDFEDNPDNMQVVRWMHIPK